jgi:hypothetical protein
VSRLHHVLSARLKKVEEPFLAGNKGKPHALNLL